MDSTSRMFYQFEMRSGGVVERAMKLNRARLNVRIDGGALATIAGALNVSILNAAIPPYLLRNRVSLQYSLHILRCAHKYYHPKLANSRSTDT